MSASGHHSSPHRDDNGDDVTFSPSVIGPDLKVSGDIAGIERLDIGITIPQGMYPLPGGRVQGEITIGPGNLGTSSPDSPVKPPVSPARTCRHSHLRSLHRYHHQRS